MGSKHEETEDQGPTEDQNRIAVLEAQIARIDSELATLRSKLHTHGIR